MSGLPRERDTASPAATPPRAARSRSSRRRRLASLTFAAAAHAVVLFALVGSRPDQPRAPDADAVTVTLAPMPRLVEPPPPREGPAPAKAPSHARPAAPTRPTPLQAAIHPVVRPTPPPPDVTPLPVAQARPTDQVAELTEAQLAGATTAGSGGEGAGSGGGGEGGAGGRACDMVRRLQGALRRDADIQAAVARAHRAAGASGRAILVWNGDWVRSVGQDGKGLAGVRQAIALEVAFAPEACRARPMRGLVLISLNDAPGSAGLALGGGDWRWSDLLAARR